MKKYLILIAFFVLYLNCYSPTEVDYIEDPAKNKFIIIGTVWNKGDVVANTPIVFEYNKSTSSTYFRQIAYTSKVGAYYLEIRYGNYTGEYVYKIQSGTIKYFGVTKKGTTVTHNFIHK